MRRVKRMCGTEGWTCGSWNERFATSGSGERPHGHANFCPSYADSPPYHSGSPTPASAPPLARSVVQVDVHDATGGLGHEQVALRVEGAEGDRELHRRRRHQAGHDQARLPGHRIDPQ